MADGPGNAPTGTALFNREFSWIEFNRRVLAEAEDAAVPLLDRVKFLSIASTNLDEFQMVRVGTIRELIASGIQERSADGLTPKQQLKGIRERTRRLLAAMYECLDVLLPKLRKAGVRIKATADLTKRERIALRELYDNEIAATLTPLAVDPGHPFPFLATRALNLAIVLESGRGESHVAFMKVPPRPSRFIPIPGSRTSLIPIESLIAMHVADFFPGLKVRRVIPMRVIRNADLLLPEDEIQDLLKSVETELRRRERKEVVWIEIARDADETLMDLLEAEIGIKRDDIFFAPSLLKLGDLMELYERTPHAKLKEAPFNPRIPSQLASAEDIFSIIRRGDLLLHRPFDSFTTIVEFVQTAAEDPDVVAIKQTLYRTEAKSLVVDALARAAERGKQVTAVVELQARFDEQKNIAWARRLEEAGVQVVYGLIGMKVHGKVCLVIRREAGELRRYVHLSTGNYNALTARIYTDLDLLTANEAFGDDASNLFNVLTGYSITTIQEMFEHYAKEWEWEQLILGPVDYHAWTLQQIERETRHAREGRPAHIIAKLNSLVEPAVIRALYAAAQAGVKIDLIVRGICCLVPNDNIRVVSIVDRFLEHTRVFLFRNGGDTEVWLSSGDWMPRNFFRRIELTWPILAPELRERIEKQILATYLADNAKSWKLQPDGTYKKRSGDASTRSQARFMEIARAEAALAAPYEEVIKKPGAFRKKAGKTKKR
ncbi:MAG TPA: polyphosphate kinase 1 [Thermoanaerobaculia bacterium]|nr:polyphosphate kinase 1 [Thermoanaerobaculia bacterium]